MAHLFNAEKALSRFLNGNGHHWVTGPIRKSSGLSADAKRIFNSRGFGTTGPLDGHYFNSQHRAYSSSVETLWKQYLSTNNIDPAKMTSKQATQFIIKIWNARTPAIANFRWAVNAARNRYLLNRGYNFKGRHRQVVRGIPRIIFRYAD